MVIFVGDGKGSKALEPFWKRLKRSKTNIEEVAMDISPAYGPLAGTNDKIKTMKRKGAYGFTDMEFFKLKIMSLHETKYVLIG